MRVVAKCGGTRRGGRQRTETADATAADGDRRGTADRDGRRGCRAAQIERGARLNRVFVNAVLAERGGVLRVASVPASTTIVPVNAELLPAIRPCSYSSSGTSRCRKDSTRTP